MPILLLKNIKTEIDINEKKFYIKSTAPKGWILIRDAFVEDWTIFFNENQLNNKNEEVFPRFNKRGLTGCLNFYKTKFINTNIKINNSSCEDGLNIMNSKGTLNQVNIKNASSDGLDLDFSKFNINNLNVSNSSNDCLDVSGGQYYIKNGYLKSCFDKGLSVGEKSNVIVESLKVESANIAVSVKDYSNINLKSIFTKDTPILYRSKAKNKNLEEHLQIL